MPYVSAEQMDEAWERIEALEEKVKELAGSSPLTLAEIRKRHPGAPNWWPPPAR